MPATTPPAKLRKAMRRKLTALLYPSARKVPVNCSLTSDENAELERRARRLGMRKTTCLKELAFAYSENRYLIPTNTEAKLEALIVLFRNVSTNINQIARRANSNCQTSYADYLKLKEEVLTLEDRIKRATRSPKLADQSSNL